MIFRKLIADNLFICKFIAVDIYLLLVFFFHTDLWLFIISLFFVVIYLLTERLKDKKEQVGIDVCIVPVITTMFAGFLSFYVNNLSDSSPFYANNISDSSPFLPFYNVSTYLFLSSEPKGILSFLTLHIAACVGWVTFWAFWSQIKANALTVENFEKQQITEQYFEMMKVHRDNVPNLEIISSISNEKPINHNKKIEVKGFQSSKNIQKDQSDKSRVLNSVVSIKGIKVFDKLKSNYEDLFVEVEKELIQFILLDSLTGNSEEKKANILYSNLINDDETIKNPELNDEIDFGLWLKLQYHISRSTYYFIYDGTSNEINNTTYDSKKDKFYVKLEDVKEKAYRNSLTHYYRNLFQTVKYIVNQNEQLFSYKQKRNKLRMLRAQMNNCEQIMLFYNWFSSYGKQWESAWNEKDGNKFLTDYRMIHNLHYRDLDKTIFKDMKDDKTKRRLLKHLFNNLTEVLGDGKGFHYELLKEEGKLRDPLFEFSDWEE